MTFVTHATGNPYRTVFVFLKELVFMKHDMPQKEIKMNVNPFIYSCCNILYLHIKLWSEK